VDSGAARSRARSRYVSLAGALILATALGLYYAFHEELWEASLWWDIVFIALVLIPACFALVWFVRALPLDHGWLVAALVCSVLALVFHFAGWNGAENFAKLLGVSALGFWFLRWFELVSWVVLVAVIIPWVDAYSVWRGPTKTIVTEHEYVFTHFSFAFARPGEANAANLGLPDLLFFALFLGAAVRFGLRPGLTWVLMTLSFGATLALAVWADLDGLPALPLLSLGFLVANGDLLWKRLRPGADGRS
jgi:hypothetical protein